MAEEARIPFGSSAVVDDEVAVTLHDDVRARALLPCVPQRSMWRSVVEDEVAVTLHQELVLRVA